MLSLGSEVIKMLKSYRMGPAYIPVDHSVLAWMIRVLGAGNSVWMVPAARKGCKGSRTKAEWKISRAERATRTKREREALRQTLSIQVALNHSNPCGEAWSRGAHVESATRPFGHIWVHFHGAGWVCPVWPGELLTTCMKVQTESNPDKQKTGPDLL